MFNESQAFETRDARETAVIEVHRRLRLRVVTDRLLMPASVDWARDRVRADEFAGIGADGRFSALELKVRMTHLAGQHAAVIRAAEQLRAPFRDREDDMQLVCCELLQSIEDRPMWCCDHGRPSVRAARADLAKRVGYRRIDELRRRGHFHDHDGSDLSIFGIDEGQLGELLSSDEFDAFVRERLAGPIARWDRFCRWALDGIPHKQLAEELGTKPAAVRQEMSRLRRELKPIVEAWRRACEGGVADDDGEFQLGGAVCARAG